jgi:hypothetical protein
MWHQVAARMLIKQEAVYDPFLVNSRERYKYTTPYAHIHGLMIVDSIYPMGKGKVNVTLYLPDGDKTRSFDNVSRATTYISNQLSTYINRERAARRERIRTGTY